MKSNTFCRNSNSSVKWVSPQLRNLFLNPSDACDSSSSVCPSASTQPVPSETGPASGSGSDSSPSSNQPSYVGPVIGGVFGGLAFISLVAGLATWLVLRRRRYRQRLERPDLAQLPDSLPGDYRREKYHSASVQEVLPSKTASSEHTDESRVVSPLTATTIDTNPHLPQFRQELSADPHPQELEGEAGIKRWASGGKTSVSESPLSPISEGSSTYSRTLSRTLSRDFASL